MTDKQIMFKNLMVHFADEEHRNYPLNNLSYHELWHARFRGHEDVLEAFIKILDLHVFLFMTILPQVLHLNTELCKEKSSFSQFILKNSLRNDANSLTINLI